jgi:hypothetical protein
MTKSKTAAYAVAALALLATFHGYGHTPDGFNLYRLIDADDLPAAEFLKSQPPGLILAQPKTGSALPALTGQRVLADYYFIGQGDRRAAAEEFYNATCKRRQNILDDYQVRYVYSTDTLDCPDMRIEYSGAVKIYSYPAQ